MYLVHTFQSMCFIRENYSNSVFIPFNFPFIFHVYLNYFMNVCLLTKYMFFSATYLGACENAWITSIFDFKFTIELIVHMSRLFLYISCDAFPQIWQLSKIMCCIYV
ncbi:hypothetical protein RF11_03399 [Thelohanellus kitauei]|uniref:Uncharacterized protein n=1 Tax=Thelohanellus kitauei TaxID=669202 RepID=A0A0C2IHJ2_THEKT|nr:hypothetical protein RF11_03399 [Thelohanellus kitauei]